LNYGAVFVVQR